MLRALLRANGALLPLSAAALLAACSGPSDTANPPSATGGSGGSSVLDSGPDAVDDATVDVAADTSDDADSSAPPPGILPISVWCGPPDPYITPERYAEVADAGFTFLMPPCEGPFSAERNHRILDTALAAGLQAYVADDRMPTAITGVPDAEQRLEAIVADYASHAALAGYFVTDEPSASAFAGLGEVVAWLRDHDPSHPAFINILPNYADASQLGTATYDQYVEQYIQAVQPAVVSYDHYHFLTSGDRPGFFDNLLAVRRLSLQYQVPFRQIVLVVPHLDYRSPTEGEKRWEAMQTLAYGGQGFLDFTYWTPSDSIFGPAIIATDGTRTAHYDEVTRVNRDAQTLGGYLVGTESKAVYQVGLLSPGGAPPSPGALVLANDWPLTVGLFQGASHWYALVANRDYAQSVDASFGVWPGNRSFESLDPATGVWSLHGVVLDSPVTPVNAPLLAGGAVLLRGSGPLPDGPPGAEVMIGTVRADAGEMVLVHYGHGTSHLGPGGWDTCFDGFALGGHQFESDGFWLCLRDDLLAHTFYVGNVVADEGRFYKVENGQVTQLADAPWDTCKGGKLLGHVVESNGFWVCMD